MQDIFLASPETCGPHVAHGAHKTLVSQQPRIWQLAARPFPWAASLGSQFKTPSRPGSKTRRTRLDPPDDMRHEVHHEHDLTIFDTTFLSIN